MTVTARVSGEGGATFVCHTRDVSSSGLLLEAVEVLPLGAALEMTLLDAESGESVDVRGVAVRQALPPGGAAEGALVGVQLVEPGERWTALVARAESRTRDTLTSDRPARRLRVLVVADDVARRGAVALYVTSGWDVRFASDLAATEEALRGMRIDAVIAEHDIGDARCQRVLEAAQRAQPGARRIVRSSLHGRPSPPPGGPGDLIHRVVDLNAGLEAVLDAVSAEWSSPPPA